MKVLLVDDPSAGESPLAEALRGVDGLEVVGVAAFPGGVMSWIRASRPDVVVIDVSRIEGALELASAIEAAASPPIVVAWLGSSPGRYRAACREAGAFCRDDEDEDRTMLVESLVGLRQELCC
jgi:DNA-binding NarL/FixJ family response regulator